MHGLSIGRYQLRDAFLKQQKNHPGMALLQGCFKRLHVYKIQH
jgi:hypothetical protein